MVFKGEVTLDGGTFAGGTFTGRVIKQLNFSAGAKFNGKLLIVNTSIENCSMGFQVFDTQVSFIDTEFKNGLNLATAVFNGGLDLGNTKFKKLLDFNGCRISKLLNWKDACYAGEGEDGIRYRDVNFADTDISRPEAPYPVCKN